ncbi:MAG: tRNA preQ1(34) S-adenosylmethionine ribosyltransferase-isomerase QueA [Betaproteobacteria bacterium]|nr:tRNA preQ1(34) S-adenosylmethionine ribosyltransferase-isomerase QueA [Betaproteobacteria bacterium]
MKLSDFDYELPESLIALHPPRERSASRLLVVPPAGELADRRVTDLPSLLRAGDLLVMNDTRVIRARLTGIKADSGGRVEVLIERITGTHEAVAQIRASKTPRPGMALTLGEARATVGERLGEFHALRFDEPVDAVLAREGSLPLPPYIDRPVGADDDERYQTVYAREPGAVAAPTAGLHFDEPLLQALAQAGVGIAFVTLHVGAGTFQPVRVEEVSAHRMHSERYTVPEATAQAIARTRAAGGRIIAVGTTSLRTLESVADDQGRVPACQGETALFITPGCRLKVADLLFTNFHLPRSTLLMLVSAFAGVRRIREAYAHAIAQRYRFFSYGDAMLLTRDDDALAH